MAKTDESKIKTSVKSKDADNVIELARVKEALKSSENNFSSLLERNADGIAILDKHTIVFVNQKMSMIAGYSGNEIPGKQFIDLIAPEYHDLLKANYEMTLVSGEPNSLEMEIIAGDGRKIPVETRAQFIVFKGKTATMVEIRDVTEQKLAEDALKLSEQNFRNSMDSSSVGIRISDNSGYTSYVNKALLDIFGYENLDEVKTTPPQKFYSAEAYASYLARHEKLLRGEPMPKQVDVDIIRKDGSVRHLDVSMREIFWDGKQQKQTLYNDITERKQAEEALHESEEKYRLIVENSSDFIYTLNENGEFIYVSPSVKKSPAIIRST